MKILLELSARDVQSLIRTKIQQEASKHNHPDNMDVQILVFDGTGARGSLEQLELEVHASFEEKAPTP